MLPLQTRVQASCNVSTLLHQKSRVLIACMKQTQLCARISLHSHSVFHADTLVFGVFQTTIVIVNMGTNESLEFQPQGAQSIEKLLADVENERLYWNDFFGRKMSHIQWDGTNQTTVLEFPKGK